MIKPKEKNCLIFKRVSLKLLPLVEWVRPLAWAWLYEPVQHDGRCIPCVLQRTVVTTLGCGGFTSVHITMARCVPEWHFCRFIMLYFVFARKRGIEKSPVLKDPLYHSF